MALDSLPANPPTDKPETLRATGTDGADPQQYPQQRARETVRHDASWRGGGADEVSSDNAPKRLASATLCDEVPHGATLDKNAPDRIRTCDLRFRRPPLYPAELPGQGAPSYRWEGAGAWPLRSGPVIRTGPGAVGRAWAGSRRFGRSAAGRPSVYGGGWSSSSALPASS